MPTRQEQALCRPYLDAEIGLVNLRLIITVGGALLFSLPPGGLATSSAGYFRRMRALPAAETARAQELVRFDPSLNREGRWLVPLPHPSGASLWHNDPHNQQRLQHALAIVAGIRRHCDL